MQTVQKEIDLDFLKKFMRYLDKDAPLDKKEALERMLLSLNDPEESADLAMRGLQIAMDDPIGELLGARFLHMGVLIGVAFALGSKSKFSAHLAEKLFSKPGNVTDISAAFAKRQK